MHGQFFEVKNLKSTKSTKSMHIPVVMVVEEACEHHNRNSSKSHSVDSNWTYSRKRHNLQHWVRWAQVDAEIPWSDHLCCLLTYSWTVEGVMTQDHFCRYWNHLYSFWNFVAWLKVERRGRRIKFKRFFKWKFKTSESEQFWNVDLWDQVGNFPPLKQVK